MKHRDLSIFKLWSNVIFPKMLLRGIKSRTGRQLQTSQRHTNISSPTTSHWALSHVRRISVWLVISQISVRIYKAKLHNTGWKNKGIHGKINCSSSNVICSYQCRVYHKEYLRETDLLVRVRTNGHRFLVNVNQPRSLLLAYLEQVRIMYKHLMLLLSLKF